MRTFTHGLRATALALTLTFYATPSSHAEPKTEATLLVNKAITAEGRQSRSQLLLASMVVAFATVLLLRRNSAGTE